MIVVQELNCKDGFTIQGKAYTESSPNENKMPCSKCTLVNLTIYKCQVLNECLPTSPLKSAHMYLRGFSLHFQTELFSKSAGRDYIL